MRPCSCRALHEQRLGVVARAQCATSRAAAAGQYAARSELFDAPRPPPCAKLRVVTPPGSAKTELGGGRQVHAACKRRRRDPACMPSSADRSVCAYISAHTGTGRCAAYVYVAPCGRRRRRIPQRCDHVAYGTIANFTLKLQLHITRLSSRFERACRVRRRPCNLIVARIEATSTGIAICPRHRIRRSRSWHNRARAVSQWELE